MTDKLLIAVSARQVSVALWHGKSFVECDMFTYSDDGLSAFKEHLAKVRNVPVLMMADAVEEDYRFESLPHSFGRDRTELVNRKLNQHYRNTPYCSARLQGRDPGKRRDDRYLFCALTNPDLINGWVQAVLDRGLPLAGIYLLPTVSQEMVAKLQLKQMNLLVVSPDSSGLRLTFFRDQKLRISRLARIDASGPQTLKSYADEVSNTRLYLHALRIMTLDEHLAVLIVDADNSLTELAEVIARDNPLIESRRLGREEIIERVGISPHALESSGDAIYLHLLGLHAPASNLAPPNVTQGYRHHQARRGIYAFAGAAGAATLIWCAFNWYQILDIRQSIKADIAATAQQTIELKAKYDEAARLFPHAPTSADNMRRAVEISKKIEASSPSPEKMMSVVSRALERNPGIALKTLGWKYGRTDIEADPTKSTRQAVDPLPGGAARRQSGLVEGEIRPFRGDYRTAIEAINRFAEVLVQQPEVADVKVIKLPLNISPTLALSGNTTDGRDRAGIAEFKLLLVLK